MLCFKVHIKKKYELWCLVGLEPARFSLIEFEPFTSLNCDYVENQENPRCEDDRMRLGYLAIFTGFIEGRKFSTVTQASLARLVMDLEEFENYLWGRVALKVLMDSLWNKDLTKSYTIDGFVQVIQVWVYYALPEFRAEYGYPVQNKSSPPLLAYNGGKGRRFFKDVIKRQFVVVYAKNEECCVKEKPTMVEERPRKKARKEAEESPREAEESPRETEEAPLGLITQ
ncbi:hypothetical protein N665_0497s0030 [Sinapis alba]|nr:hypothetical protein N665_0497s0030 [Sinapis alba]